MAALLCAPPLGEYQCIDADAIDPDPNQPRQDIGDLEDLKASIAEHGILQPVIVSPGSGGRYMLIAGERRLRAAAALGMAQVPAIVRTVEHHRRLELQLVENLLRKDLCPVEEALAYERLIQDFRLSQRELARRLGKSPASINESLRILDLPAEILRGVRTSEHSTRSVLLEIAKQPTREKQLSAWEALGAAKPTTRAAREAREARTPARPRPSNTHTIATTAATVTVRFSRPYERSEVVRALEEALDMAGDEGFRTT